MALLVALSGMFATTFPITVLTLAIPRMAEDMGVDEAAMSWVVTLPILASALALPALGKLGDLYGHRRVFLTGFALAVLATFLSATATSAVVLIMWRTFAQVLGGATMPSSLALINSVHTGEKRARAMGWWAMVSAGAPVIGLMLGAPAIDAVGWQALFFLQGCFMVVPVVAAAFVLRETDRAAARFDVPGMLALALGCGPLLFAVNQAPEWGFTHPAILACVLVAGAGIVTFVLVERRVAAPLLPDALIRTRDGAASISSAFFTGASYMGAFFLASLLMVEEFGYSATAAVPILAIRPFLFAATSPLGGRLTGRSGTRFASVAGCIALTVGVAGLAAGSALSSLVVVVAVGYVGQGIGYGLLRPGITTALANAVHQRDLGIAGATERLAGQIGVAFGIATLATIYGGDTDRFAPAFAFGAVLGALGLLCALAMRPGVMTPPDDDATAGDEGPGAGNDRRERRGAPAVTDETTTPASQEPRANGSGNGNDPAAAEPPAPAGAPCRPAVA
jgi:MFS family permease